MAFCRVRWRQPKTNQAQVVKTTRKKYLKMGENGDDVGEQASAGRTSYGEKPA